LRRLKAERARRRLHEFVVQAWHVLEPDTPFIDGIHVQAICEHLQAITEGRLRNLIVNVPPGHAKSLLTAVFWPAWAWIDHPESRWLFSSYREPLATRDSVKCRRLIESPWYRERWGDRYQLAGDQNQKNRFENSATGYRVVVPMSSGTGERGDYVVVDDPHSVDQAASDAERQSAIEWWSGSMSTRLNDFAQGHKIVIQQRVHEADLTGDLLQRGGYELLCLPAEFEPDRRCSTCLGWQDPRTSLGELLWPEKVTQADLDGLKTTLGSYRYAGQYQQRPAPAGGGMLKNHWWRYWQSHGANLPPVPIKMPDGTMEQRKAVDLPTQFDQQLQSWDMAFKDTKKADYVVGQVQAAKGADRYLLDQVRDRMDLPGHPAGGAASQRPLAQRDAEAGGGQSQRPGGGSVPAARDRQVRRGQSGRRQGFTCGCRQPATGVGKLVSSSSDAGALGRGVPRGMRGFPNPESVMSSRSAVGESNSCQFVIGWGGGRSDADDRTGRFADDGERMSAQPSQSLSHVASPDDQHIRMLLPCSLSERGGDIAAAKEQFVPKTCLIHQDLEFRLCASNEVPPEFHLAAIARGFVERGNHMH
jgi:hypothetical protein